MSSPHAISSPLSISVFQVVQVLRAIDRDEGGNDSTVYFSIPPESSAALNFSVRDSGGRLSISPPLLIPSFFPFSLGRDTLFFPLLFLRLLILQFLSAVLFPSSSFLPVCLSFTRLSNPRPLYLPPPLVCLCLSLLPSISQLRWPHCFALLFSSLLFVPSCLPPRVLDIHLLSSRRPHTLTVYSEKLLEKSELLLLIHFNQIEFGYFVFVSSTFSLCVAFSGPLSSCTNTQSGSIQAERTH